MLGARLQGRIDVPHGIDAYRFAGRAGQRVSVHFRSLGGGEDCGKWDLGMRLLDDHRNVIGDGWVGNSGCRVYGPFRLPHDGQYMLELAGGDGGLITPVTGTYRARLRRE